MAAKEKLTMNYGATGDDERNGYAVAAKNGDCKERRLEGYHYPRRPSATVITLTALVLTAVVLSLARLQAGLTFLEVKDFPDLARQKKTGAYPIWAEVCAAQLHVSSTTGLTE
jgi:hypothetical protein